MAAAIAVPVVAFWGAGSVVRAVEGGSISGTVYFDTDMDGQRDPGEAPAPGKTVALLMGEDEIEVSTMKSASDGRYHFDRLLPDASYAAKVVHDVDTPCTVGGVYYLPGSEVSTGADLGVIASGDRTVSGTLTSDLNENGMRDAGEPPLGGWHLRLTGYTGLECEADFTTVENGEFKFGQLPGGIYNINVKTAGPTLSQRVAWELTFATRPFDLPGAYPNMRFPDASVDLESSKSVEGMVLGVHVLSGTGSITGPSATSTATGSAMTVSSRSTVAAFCFCGHPRPVSCFSRPRRTASASGTMSR